MVPDQSLGIFYIRLFRDISVIQELEIGTLRRGPLESAILNQAEKIVSFRLVEVGKFQIMARFLKIFGKGALGWMVYAENVDLMNLLNFLH